MKAEKVLKKETLRYNEYYNMQSQFDELYGKSKENCIFKQLYQIIVKRENVLLAYRTIKSNSGSHTPGTNRHTIEHWEDSPTEEYITYIISRLDNYHPQPVRRVEIPKPNGNKRPLGIPCIEDRIIQQCIKQVLEPICEAKFHPNSFGFRPNRSTEHAIAYVYRKINLDKCHYVVDIDIKGFFDNVNHGKLLRQIWALGIQDKKVLSILSVMLKAEVKGIGIPTKGVPQGGILSPLLSNIVLNELDWWLSDQWETFESRHTYTQNGSKYTALRKSNLKEIYVVRYADDFKIVCRDEETAQKIYNATKYWLMERLGLETSPEKSRITNLKKKYTEFLGFKIKATKKKDTMVVKSHMTDKAKKKVETNLKNQIKEVQHNPNSTEVLRLNAMIAGMQNYYRLATNVSLDFSEINYNLSKCMNNRFKSIASKDGYKTREYENRYKGYTGKTWNVAGVKIYLIYAVRTQIPICFNPKVCNYTEDGRSYIHQTLGGINYSVLKHLMQHPSEHRSVEFNDNRLSKYTAQKGTCPISGMPLGIFLEVHHIKPVSKGGTDEYRNLVLVTYSVHKLIHATNVETISEYLEELKLDKEALKKLNKFRKKVGNDEILNE